MTEHSLSERISIGIARSCEKRIAGSIAIPSSLATAQQPGSLHRRCSRTTSKSATAFPPIGGEGTYYWGKITERNGDDIHISYDDGGEEDTTIDVVRVVRPRTE